MVRSTLVVFVVSIVGLAVSPLYAAASPAHSIATLGAQDTVAMGVDSSVLKTQTVGPAVASGKLTDSAGLGTAGTIAALAWPNEAYNRKEGAGTQVPTPTVGWALAGSDGSFTLHVDPSKIGADHMRTDGSVNLIALGWTQKSQGFWSFTAQVGPSSNVARITIAAHQPLVAAKPVASSPGKQVVCGWVGPKSTYDAMSIIGQTEPWGADTGSMVSNSTEATSVGAAYSYTGGGYGSWSQSGSSTTSVGTSKTWLMDTNYKNYQRQIRYGKYQYCYGSTWGEFAMYGTGGYGSALIGYEYYSQCAPLDGGYCRVATRMETITPTLQASGSADF